MRFSQVKLITRDVDRLVGFYRGVFGCEMALPLTTLDETAAQAVGAPGSGVAIAILTVPGVGEPSPTLEIYTFVSQWPADWRHEPGQGQVAFEVDDVDGFAARVLDSGGDWLGSPRDWTAPGGQDVRFVFMTDPDGNVVDLFARSTEPGAADDHNPGFE